MSHKLKLIPPHTLNTVMKYSKAKAINNLTKSTKYHQFIQHLFQPYSKLLEILALNNIHQFGRREKTLLLEDITQDSLSILEEYLEKIGDDDLLRNIFFHLHLEYCYYLDNKLQRHRLVNQNIIRQLEKEFDQEKECLRTASDEFLIHYFTTLKDDVTLSSLANKLEI